MILADYANEKIELAKVIKMVLIHDIVEIDAGDTIVYDTQGRALACEEECAAAERIFGLLPDNQKEEFLALWHEFTEKKTPEAKFASAIDRFQPILQNYLTDYYAWRTHGVTYRQLHNINEQIVDGSEVIWKFAQRIFSEAKEMGAIEE